MPTRAPGPRGGPCWSPTAQPRRPPCPHPRLQHLPAVGRALDILLFLAGRTGPVRAGVLARELGMPRSSAYHILAVLAERGFVTYLPGERAYGLGVAAFEIGSAYLRHEPLERLAQPVVRRLAG
ncbi:helix-turn-helix domain-containing protein [Actinomadura keratinilytica]